MGATYDELAARAERGELVVKSGTVRRGGDAAAAAQSALLAAAGVSDLDALTRVVLGRPAVGAGQGVSPVVRARVPQALKDLVVAVAEREGRKESDVVRDALAAYVAARASGE